MNETGTTTLSSTDEALEALGIVHLTGEIGTDQSAGTYTTTQRDDVTGALEHPAAVVQVTCRCVAYIPTHYAAEPLTERMRETADTATMDEDMRLLLRVLAAGIERRTDAMPDGEERPTTARPTNDPRTDDASWVRASPIEVSEDAADGIAGILRGIAGTDAVSEPDGHRLTEAAIVLEERCGTRARRAEA